MLYHVRLQFGIHVDADSDAEAFSKACRALRDNPGSHIAAVKQAAAPNRSMPLWKRIVTGR